MRWTRFAPSTPYTQRSLFWYPKCACCPVASSRWTMRHVAHSRDRWREEDRSDPTKSRIYKGHGHGRGHGERDTTCPCSSMKRPRSSNTWAQTPKWSYVVTSTRPCAASGGNTRAPSLPATRPRAPHSSAGRLVPQTRGLLHLANAHAQLAIRGSEPVDWARPPAQPEVWSAAGKTPAQAGAVPFAKPPIAPWSWQKSAGRRESLLELLRDHRIELPAIDSLKAFADSDHQRAIVVAPWLAASSGKTRTARTRPAVHHRDRTV